MRVGVEEEDEGARLLDTKLAGGKDGEHEVQVPEPTDVITRRRCLSLKNPWPF